MLLLLFLTTPFVPLAWKEDTLCSVILKCMNKNVVTFINKFKLCKNNTLYTFILVSTPIACLVYI